MLHVSAKIQNQAGHQTTHTVRHMLDAILRDFKAGSYPCYLLDKQDHEHGLERILCFKKWQILETGSRVTNLRTFLKIILNTADGLERNTIGSVRIHDSGEVCDAQS